MTQKILFPDWDLLSREEQESLRDWIKAILKVKKAEAKLMNTYLSKDVNKSSYAAYDEDFSIVSSPETDTIDFETFIKNSKEILLALTSCSSALFICMAGCRGSNPCREACKITYQTCIGGIL